MNRQADVIGIFRHRHEAEQAVEELRRAGFQDSEINFGTGQNAALTLENPDVEVQVTVSAHHERAAAAADILGSNGASDVRNTQNAEPVLGQDQDEMNRLRREVLYNRRESDHSASREAVEGEGKVAPVSSAGIGKLNEFHEAERNARRSDQGAAEGPLAREDVQRGYAEKTRNEMVQHPEAAQQGEQARSSGKVDTSLPTEGRTNTGSSGTGNGRSKSQSPKQPDAPDKSDPALGR